MQQTAQPPSHQSHLHHLSHLHRPIVSALALALVLALALTMAPLAPAHASPGAATARTVAISTAGIDPRLRHRRTFRTRVIQISRSKRGAPYRYGAAGPRAFDCSGYTSWVYRKAGRHIPRTSRQQAAASRHIRVRNRRRGDLVFFASRGRVYHVGIYAGHGTIWHAPRPGKRVHRERIWTRKRFFGRFR